MRIHIKNKKYGTTELFSRLFPSPFGPVVILWSYYLNKSVILRILLSDPIVSAKQKEERIYPGAADAACSRIDEITDTMQAYFKGNDVQFSLRTVRLDLCSQFQQNVLQAEYGIPRGSVSTYQRIAAHLGKAKGARAVGHALATNPFPVIIPCHRAVCSDRAPGGFQGGTKMKRALLEMEGIRFNKAGFIITTDFYY
jgi:methylated-DNA-[protein]-cysteine S-methyltransferase